MPRLTPSSRFAALLAAVAFARVTAISAQDTDLADANPAAEADPVAAELTAPVVQSDTHVPYPTGANGDATVVLELVISPDGAVTEATVVEGDEPFATQARTSVLQWRFTPAQRGATPIAARIRARVDFHQDLPVAPTSAPAPSAAAAPQPSAAEKLAVLEVTIRGERNENGQTTFSIEEVRALPGAFGDPFRAIDALPGVIPVVSGFPYFFIRGAPPNDNAYYVDGIRVPLLFHIGLGQGVIHPSLVDRVDFIPGAPPASYSGSAGAIIAGQTRDPSPELRIAANLRLVDAGALLEVPFADGRGSALIAGRYGYPGPIVGAFANDVSLGYWDYQTRASWLFADRDSLRLFAFGSHDYLATGTPLTEQFVSDFHRVSLRYEHALSDGYVRAEGLFGYDRRGADPSYLTGTSTALRLELDQALSPAVRIRAGVAASFDDSCGAIQRRSRTLRQASAR